MTGYRGFSSRAEYEKHYSGPLPQWEMTAMEEYSREAEEGRKQWEMTNPNLLGTMRDISVKEGVQIQIQKDGLIVWVNVDGVCIARLMVPAQAIIEIEDGRK